MVPIWIALAFLSFMTLFLAVDIPKREAARNEVQIAYDTSSITAYGRSVTAYLTANPTVTGKVDNTTLSAFWPLGYTHTDGSLWSNYIDTGGKLYIFSLSPANNEILSGLYRIYGDTLFVGTKGSDGYLHSLNGVTIPIPTVAGIPNGAIVVLGKWNF